jgi:hypothetical protein
MQQGRLAAPGRPDDAEKLALANLEIDPRQGARLPLRSREFFGQPMNDNSHQSLNSMSKSTTKFAKDTKIY